MPPRGKRLQRRRHGGRGATRFLRGMRVRAIIRPERFRGDPETRSGNGEIVSGNSERDPARVESFSTCPRIVSR